MVPRRKQRREVLGGWYDTWGRKLTELWMSVADALDIENEEEVQHWLSKVVALY